MIEMLDISTLKIPRVSLEQWCVLQAVIDCGSYAAAAERLHRSQSSVSYAVARMQEQLGVPLLKVEGRKAQLTAAGEALLRRSRQLVSDALELEQFAHDLERGWEPEIRLVVDAAFPNAYLIEALRRFAPRSGGTRVQLNEVVLSGSEEALLEGRADLVIAPLVPAGYLGEPLLAVEFVAVAHHAHPLHQIEPPLLEHDLRRELQVVVRDSGLYRKRDVGWLGAEYRWTVTSIETALDTVCAGLAFGWLPCSRVEGPLAQGLLKVLPLREGQRQRVQLHLIFGQHNTIGPATAALADTIRQLCADDASGK